MLVLLVIFMVTAPILQQGVSVDLPRARGGPLAREQERLVVTVGKEGRVYLNDRLMDLSGLQARLTAVAGEGTGRQVYLRADRRVPYGDVMAVLAAVKAAGVRRLGMVTEPPESAK